MPPLLLVLAGCHRTPDAAHTDATDTTETVPLHTGHTGPGSTSGSADHTGGTGSPLTDEELLTLAVYWGVPLVVTGRTVHDRPYNTLGWNSDGPGPGDGRGGAPNPDVVYAITIADLRSEPLVLTTRDNHERYWSIQMDTFWSEAFRYLGTRATNGDGGEYLLVPPGYTGLRPTELEVIEAPSPQAVLLTRIQIKNRDDLPNAVAHQSDFSLQPLSTYMSWTPPAPPPPIPLTGVMDGSLGRDGILFWDELCAMLASSPPVAEEQPFLDGLARFGIVPGAKPSEEVTDPAIRALLDDVVDDAMDTIYARIDYNVWRPVLDIGVFHGDWLFRAASSVDGWIAHVPEEGVYAPSPLMDVNGTYRIHFDAEDLPEVSAYWTIVAYDAGRYLMDNPIDRYSVNSSNPDLVYNKDGSIDFVVAADFPGAPIQNWIPTDAAAGQFSLMFRAYLPGEDILSGKWQLPPIVPDP